MTAERHESQNNPVLNSSLIDLKKADANMSQNADINADYGPG